MPAAPATARCVVMVGTDAVALAARHGRLIAASADRHDKVVCLVPNGSPPTVQALMRTGAILDNMSFEKRGFGPLAAYRIRRALAVAVATHAPDVIVATDVASLVPLAAALDPKRGIRLLYWPVIAQTVSDVEALMLDRTASGAFERIQGLVAATHLSARRFNELAPSADVQVIPSEAIDLTDVTAASLPSPVGGIVFRCITADGDAAAHAVFQAAARDAARHAPTARFVIGGSRDKIIATHVVVHVGTEPRLPAELVTALALGRPIITTDVEGARDTVDERINGWRVVPGDASGLAEAIVAAAQRPALLPVLGRASRAKAERHFDADAHLRTGLTLLRAPVRKTIAAA